MKFNVLDFLFNSILNLSIDPLFKLLQKLRKVLFYNKCKVFK